jgi:hypothetical protein
MEQRRTRSRKPKAAPARAAQTDVGQEIVGVLLTAAGIWFLLALAGKGGGALGTLISDGLKTSAGEAGAWMLSLGFIWLGCYFVYLRFHKRPFEWGRRAWGLVLLWAGFEVVLQLLRYSDPTSGGGDFENARGGYGGGIIGWALTVPLTRIFGVAGRYVALVAAMLVGLVLNTDITLGGVVHWLKEKVFAGARGAGGVLLQADGQPPCSDCPGRGECRR